MFDFRDVMLEAQAEVQETMREVARELVSPKLLAQARQAWLSAPNDVKEAFKREKPREYAEMMEEFSRR